MEPQKFSNQAWRIKDKITNTEKVFYGGDLIVVRDKAVTELLNSRFCNEVWKAYESIDYVVRDSELDR